MVGADVGDSVQLVQSPAPALEPEELIQLLRPEPQASANWRALTPARRRQLVEHVAAAKKSETRSRRTRLDGSPSDKGEDDGQSKVPRPGTF